jgi:hypothetical protein
MGERRFASGRFHFAGHGGVSFIVVVRLGGNGRRLADSPPVHVKNGRLVRFLPCGKRQKTHPPWDGLDKNNGTVVCYRPLQQLCRQNYGTVVRYSAFLLPAKQKKYGLAYYSSVITKKDCEISNLAHYSSAIRT